jgi:hypothetical protein
MGVANKLRRRMILDVCGENRSPEWFACAAGSKSARGGNHHYENELDFAEVKGVATAGGHNVKLFTKIYTSAI